MNDVSKAPNAMQHETITAVEFEPSRGTRDGGRVWRMLALGGTFLAMFLLAFGAWFMFTGHSVRVEVTPAPEELELSGGLLRVNLGDRWLLRPGDYVVTASAEGYFDLIESFTVDDSGEQHVSFELLRKPDIYTIAVESGDAEASVELNGELRGVAPLTSLELAVGDYELKVEAPRYKPHVATFAVDGGGDEARIDVTLDPDWAELTISSDPPGATLHVDGEPVGETPLAYDVLSGMRELELRLNGFKPWSEQFEFVAERALAVATVRLERADHIMRFASVPGGASVTIDGEYQGQTPLEVALRPDNSYRVEFTKAGYEANSRRLEIRQGDETQLAVRLQPILGTITIVGAPAGAEVYADGRRRGLAGEPLELPTHPHRLEVRKDGHETQSVTVTPNATAAQRIQVALRSDEDIQLARMPQMLDTAIGYTLKLFRPSGIFRLGSARREQGRRSNEFMRQVQLVRPFYFGLREVTNAQFARFAADHDSNVVGRETLALNDQPVVRLSWQQAAAFCNWLSQREGLPAAYENVNGEWRAVSPMTTGYRMPTEAEWALIARYEGLPEGRAALKYGWGTGMPPPAGSGNLAGSEAADLVSAVLSGYSDPYPATATVGEFSANGAGIFDLTGNVSEWIHDYYTIRPAGAGAVATDPAGPAEGLSHVIRGSSWRSASITELRLAWRDEGVDARDDVGLRIARYAE